MEYKEAKKIREKSFGTLLAEHEGGFGSSLSAAISQKTQAKMTGMKEKFDPMNIAKFVTGGSNWAPAMLGKLTGRKQSSIDYFSGVKGRSKSTAEKLGKVESGGTGDFLGILHTIESLLHKTREDDKLRHEEDKNFEEERQLEKARRHKELISAITGKPYKETGNTTATKVDDKDNESPGLGLMDLLGGASAIKDLAKILSFFTGGLGLALLTGVGLAGLLLKLLNDDPNAEETNKGIINAGATDGGLGAAIQEARSDEVASRKAVILREAHKSGQIKSSWYEFGKQDQEEKQYLKSIGFDDKTGLTQKDRDNGFNAVDEDGNPYFSKYRAQQQNEQSKEVPSPETSTQKNETSSSPTSMATPVSTVSENKGSAATTESTTPSVASVQSTPAMSQALNQVQKENLDLSIPVSKPDPSISVSNNVNNVTKNGRKRTNIPLVRNNEETIQRLIFNSTRVV
jgi:hypothetical protein